MEVDLEELEAGVAARLATYWRNINTLSEKLSGQSAVSDVAGLAKEVIRADRERKLLSFTTPYDEKLLAQFGWALSAPPTYEPWTCAPTGPDVGLMIRVSHPDGRPPVLFGEYLNTGVVWPDSGYIVDPNFNTDSGGPGLYGLFSGVGDWSMIPPIKNAKWYVFAVNVSELVESDQGLTHKAPRGWVLHAGDAVGALRMIAPEMQRALREGLPKPAPSAPVGPNGSSVEFNARADATAGVRGGHAVSFSSNAYASGPRGAAVTLGENTKAMAKGRGGHAVTMDYGSHATAKGDNSMAVALGKHSTAFAQGQFSPRAATLADETFAATVFNRGRAVSLGDRSKTIAGSNSVAAALGHQSIAKAGEGGAIFLVEYDASGAIKHVFASKVGENYVQPGKFYRLKHGSIFEAGE